jgi:2-aminoadipate transaminase
MSRIQPSAIREILKVTERPEVLSFAGGLPAPEAFPVAELQRAHAEVLAADGAAALQYATTEGHAPLRAWIAARMARRGMRVEPEQVLITAGSQQGIDLVAKVLLDPGDTVVVENPSYLAALQAFQAYEARLAVVGSDEEGMRVDELERLLRRRKPKLVYVVPTFQNPRGTTLSLERRARLAELSARYGVLLLEDDPYNELRYGGEPLPAIASFEERAPIVHLGTFSKTIAPGLRLGWAIAEEEVLRALTLAKQSADLHTGALAQRAVLRMLQSFDYDAHLRRICALYGERCRAMLEALARNFPSGSQWTQPQGGLFVWARLPEGIDCRELLLEAARENVAFVPGAPFFARNAQLNTLRLNFSNRSPELIAEGMARLGACAARRMAGPPQRAAGAPPP